MAKNIIGNEGDECAGHIQSITRIVGSIDLEIGPMSYDGYILHKQTEDLNCVVTNAFSIELGEECFDALKEIADRDGCVSLNVDKEHFREDSDG